MNSNLKLLSAGLLVAALAGCGGGGGSDMSGDMDMEMTPAEECAADGGIYEDDTCKSADDLRGEGVEQEAEEKAREAAAAAAVALHKVLGTAANVPVTSGATPQGFTDADAADKSSQSITLEGDMLSDVSGLTLSTIEGLTDFYGGLTLTEAKSDAFGGIDQVTHEGNASDGDRNDFVTSGTYLGIAGTFRCTGDTCTSQDGSPTGTASDWLFKPNDAMARIEGDKIEWGWWLTETDDAVSAVNRFRHSETSDELAVSSGLEGLGSGTASYEGDATGQYAVIGDSGAFTAKASLTATFGEAAIPLSGSIHTFMGADGESRDWMVELKEIADSGSTGDGSYTNGATSWDGYEMTGAWNANMYNGSGTEAPDTILGDFRAENHGGRMVGVFGAEKE